MTAEVSSGAQSNIRQEAQVLFLLLNKKNGDIRKVGQILPQADFRDVYNFAIHLF